MALIDKMLSIFRLKDYLTAFFFHKGIYGKMKYGRFNEGFI